MKILVTGGAGFIGSAVIRHILTATSDSVVNVDKLTYAGDLESLSEVSELPGYAFEQIDICDQRALRAVFAEHQPDSVMHLAAETHVDRSIGGPAGFIETNLFGTFQLLEVCRDYFSELDKTRQSAFRLHHISTDEVFGDLPADDEPFEETSRYAPSSPYAASKAGADHLVRAWARTYKLPTIITNTSNNYGPYQYPEKLIPLVLLKALNGEQLPVYGDGLQRRDWLFVEDHARALHQVVRRGPVGETFNIGGSAECANIDVVRMICALLEELRPDKPDGVKAYEDLIAFVDDRPGHDLRYAIDASRIRRELGWAPAESFESGLRKTVAWYLENLAWCQRVASKAQEPVARFATRSAGVSR